MNKQELLLWATKKIARIVAARERIGEHANISDFDREHLAYTRGQLNILHLVIEKLEEDETWLCPYGCGKRVPYGTACENCAGRHEPIGEEVKGVGISEIANSH